MYNTILLQLLQRENMQETAYRHNLWTIRIRLLVVSSKISFKNTLTSENLIV